MKKFFLIFVFIFSILSGQEDNKTQSIELPDFVITGKESISIPKIQKLVPDFIPLLSKDFFTPQYPNEEQTTIKLPEPETKIVSIGNYKQNTNALLKFNSGLQTFPSGVFYYNDWTGNFSYSVNLFGKNELEYVKNAGITNAGAGLNTKYFIDHNSDFLPGLEIGLLGTYYYDFFNFYGSSNPNISRTTNNGLANLSLSYLSNPYNKFLIRINNSYYEQKDEVDENIFGSRAYYNLSLSNFDFTIEGNYKNQSITNVNQNLAGEYYYNTIASLGLSLNDIFNIKGGIYFSESGGNTFFAPIAFGSMKLSKGITIFGEFSPNTEFKTLQDFKTLNRFFSINNFSNLFIENNFNLKLAARYEYEKYFEISGGVGYLNSDNNFYFEDRLADGFFTIYEEDIENSYAFLNLLFRKGPFGQFYAEAKLQKITGENSKVIPYSSEFTSSLNYSFNWEYGFGFKISMLYFSEAYTDYINDNKIPAQLDLNLSLNYELFRKFQLTLDFENLLNDKYYYFRNYKAKPIDILFGFEFRW